MMTAKKKLAEMYAAHQRGDWDGRSPEELIMEQCNCREATLDAEGDVVIADPQARHWLSEDKLEDLAEGLEAKGVQLVAD